MQLKILKIKIPLDSVKISVTIYFNKRKFHLVCKVWLHLVFITFFDEVFYLKYTEEIY